MNIVDQMKELIQKETSAEIVEVVDQSAAHAGHSGNTSGGGHFATLVVSDSFEGKSLIERHQMVYKAVAPIKDAIHALSIKVATPSEWNQSQ